MKRKIIRIDEAKCNGCGQCVTGCAEGAIALVNGKATLVSETYCDGLGACIGECPVGALTLEERDGAEYDQTAVDKHLASTNRAPHQGCPGSMARSLHQILGASTPPACPGTAASIPAVASVLGNWPVQLALVPVNAPYLERASLLMAADCTAFAFPDFHRRFMKGKVALIGCPKLDDANGYREKLANIIRTNDIEFIHVVYMEVPCCSGLVRLVQGAVGDSGLKVPVKLTKIGIEGEILDESVM
ncbi:MAG TPA: 4Fe-4S dicluster domain-containing protein [Negativicutes bacterium]|nr:4Fe-4S dicluster domain-containing protein [Negativicutes bacterium]